MLMRTDGFTDDAEELLFYAERFDDKPHQFWLHAALVAKRRQLKSAEVFERWSEENPFRHEDRFTVPLIHTESGIEILMPAVTAFHAAAAEIARLTAELDDAQAMIQSLRAEFLAKSEHDQA